MRLPHVRRPVGALERDGRLERTLPLPLTLCQGVFAKNEYGLAPLRVRGLERVQLHADLVMLARLSQALSRARAVPLAA